MDAVLELYLTPKRKPIKIEKIPDRRDEWKNSKMSVVILRKRLREILKHIGLDFSCYVLFQYCTYSHSRD